MGSCGSCKLLDHRHRGKLFLHDSSDGSRTAEDNGWNIEKALVVRIKDEAALQRNIVRACHFEIYA